MLSACVDTVAASSKSVAIFFILKKMPQGSRIAKHGGGGVRRNHLLGSVNEVNFPSWLSMFTRPFPLGLMRR